MLLDLRQDSRRSSYVLSWLLFLVWMLESCFLSFDNIRPVPTYLIKRCAWFTVIGIVILGNICRTFRNEMWPVVQFYFSNMSSPSAFSVKIWIPSSASTPQVRLMCTTTSTIRERFKSQNQRQGHAEVPFSGVPLGSLAGFWDGRRLWEINSVVWNTRSIEEISMICHQCLRQSLIANWFSVVVCTCVCPIYKQGVAWLFVFIFDSEHIFDLTQDRRQFSCVIVHDMWCQWWSAVSQFWWHLTSAYLLNQWMNRYLYLGNICRTFRNEMWPVVQFYFSNMSSPSAFSVEIWIPSSASTPQVRLMCTTTSNTWAEAWKFQIRPRILEVPRSGVPLGSLAGFCDDCRLWLGSENLKEWKRFP